LSKPPANLKDGPFIWSPASPDQELKVSRIIKFGIPGTDMPGHETLSDSQVVALARFVLTIRDAKDSE
jgi:mono/diheme cytochrome c family protein